MSLDDYVPALKSRGLTALYDPLLRLTTREATFKRRLLRQARIKPRQRVLDLGCGTATLTILIKQLQPEAEVIGIDGDPQVLRIAAAKVAGSGLAITLDQGLAFELPYADGAFDRVLSSLVFHHLTRANKVRALREVFRVLRPGGEMHVADWGKAQNGLMRVAFLLVQALDGFETTADNVSGRLPKMFTGAGFIEVTQTARYTTVFGTLALYKARKPG